MYIYLNPSMEGLDIFRLSCHYNEEFDISSPHSKFVGRNDFHFW